MNLSPIYFVALLGTLVAFIFPKNKKITYCIFLFLFFLGVMRGVEVGTDCLGYQEDYNRIDKITDGKYLYHNFEIGFIALIAFFKKYVTNLYLPFVSVLFTIFYLGCIRFIFYKKVPLGIALFVLLVFSHYFYAYNIMRQMFALGLILLALPLLYEKKYVKFVVSVVVICFLFHKSSILALFLVPLHYLCLKKQQLFSKKKMSFMIVLSFIYFFVANAALKRYFAAFVGLFYSRYESYMLGMKDNLELGYTFMGAQSLFAIAMVYWFNENRKYNFEFTVYIVGVCLFNFFSAFSIVATRVAETFLIFNIVLFPLIITDGTNKCRKIIWWAVLFTGIVLFLYNYGLNNHGLVNPYYIESRIAE